MSPQKCVFGCEGKITLFSFPKKPVLCEQWMQFVFPGQQWSFASVFTCSHHLLWQMFYKQGPVRCWICTLFDTERWIGPSDKRSRSWFETADGKWNCIKFLFCWQSALKCSWLFSLSSAAFGDNRKAVSFFYKSDKTKDSYKECSTTL